MGEASIIDGKAVASQVRERVASQVAEFVQTEEVRPGLATVLVGDDPASELYVRRKREACEQVGMTSYHHELSSQASASEIQATIERLNADGSVHAILVQLPLPDHVDDAAMTALIDPAKDVDGLTPLNAGLLAQGQDAVAPCTPAGVMELLRFHHTRLDGARAVVLGRSILVGRPIASLLLRANATVTSCHSHTRDLASVCSQADVLVAAVGQPRLVGAEMVAEGATVIDVGQNRVAEGVVGDVDFDAVKTRARALTPVPGGVGPMTIAMLLHNTIWLARQRHTATR